MAFENITLEKGMYGVPGKNFTQVLEELDGSQNYAGTPFAGLDAYQRQLKRFGIRVRTATPWRSFLPPPRARHCSRNTSPAQCARAWRWRLPCRTSRRP